MIQNTPPKLSALLVIVAFAIVYIVWGSTYFFIQMAMKGFPPMILGAFRFTIAGLLLLSWCAYKGDNIWIKKDIINAGISGLFLLFGATGIVIWVEQTLPSAMVAILVSVGPIWMVLLDKPNWKVNFKNRSTITGLLVGFAGVVLLFGEQAVKAMGDGHGSAMLYAMGLLLLAPVCWSTGSLFSKRQVSNSPARMGTAWQMIIAGLAFIPAGFIHGEYKSFSFYTVSMQSWAAVLYLIFFGSIIAFSAYVWLIRVRPVTQVSTHAYVNPVVAVLLGVLFANEHITLLQVAGLAVILLSVLLINLVKYRKPVEKTISPEAPSVCKAPVELVTAD
ncbi:EamA family transporter [Pedobacter cryoconitis]|uniref:Drug/metabolite transporter (DMT)-like permease n=1 Tax=Pedobacter cryoconitis TaxID=188932 RepID=A0A7X0MHJ0_9SPHI|nr:EamA family transporter [Pedobacter cryoconitis]MBB6498901.1 drug/metabolite transporter (DMT)-like permease [Pedobacter cryoconitis]